MAPVTRTFWAPSALLPTGWAADVRLDIDANGSLVGVAAGACRAGEVLCGPIIPGMTNLHSHAFQRLIAGCTGRRGAGEDSFWTWRDAMYRSLDHLDPDDIEAVALGLYSELLEGGFTRVGEFHYVHNTPQGTPYGDPAELSRRIIAASREAGIGLTHLPVLYQTAGFEGAPAGPGQRRFVQSTDAFLRLVEILDDDLIDDPDRTVGVAPHSLRAVPQASLAALVEAVGARPIHIHIAEQQAEVAACLAVRGARPITWLTDHFPVDERWCLVHATHVDNHELTTLLDRDVVVGLCPTTEADLGDGIFPAIHYLGRGGRMGIGTDSHVGRDAAHELRLLEYGQRLVAHQRNVTLPPGESHVGAALWRHAALAGAESIGQAAGALAVGLRADFVELDTQSIDLVGLTGDTLLDAAIFGAQRLPVATVVVGGHVVVREGKHQHQERNRSRMAEAFLRIREAP